MARPPRFTAALLAALSCVVLVSACGGGGDGVPANDAALIDGSPIRVATLNHWLGITVSSMSPVTSPKRQPVPVPPDFTACIAYHRANDAKPAAGQPAPTTASLRSECQQIYTTSVNPVMNFLITADWFQREAAADGIKVAPATVEAQLKQDEAATVAQGTVASAAALQRYLAAIGETSQDELYRIGIQVLSSDLSKRATAAVPKVTAAQIAAYYNANKSSFSKPETRDLRVVLVKQLATANRVIALLKAGASFSSVVKRFSIDAATKSQGGALKGETQTGSSLPANLAAAFFKAPPHALEGPVHTTLGYEIFRVQKSTPASQETLQQASAAISSALTQQAQKTASAAYVTDLDAKWLKLTKCNSAYAVAATPPICKNAPGS